MAPPGRNVRPPTPTELKAKAERNHLTLSDKEIEYMLELIEEVLPKFDTVDELVEPRETTGKRGQGRRIETQHVEDGEGDDPYNAFVTRCEVSETDSGPLAGEQIGLKDNVAVAGVEMTCGSTIMDGHVPNYDATLVRRLLDAGGTITGKLNMTSLFAGAQGEITATGPVLNPHDPEYLAGGSSSGPAVAVVTGAVDIAIGTDQGGSVRIPASWSGCVGLKPTHGLVPYTGITSGFDAVDHAGPLTRTVDDCARALDVIAGFDPLDPRQRGRWEPTEYHDALSAGIDGKTVGLLEEGFDECNDAVASTVRESVRNLEATGATVRRVSVPWHRYGTVFNVGHIEAAAAKVRSDGVGYTSRGFYDTGFARAFGRARRTRADDFPPHLKFTLVFGQYLQDEYHGHYRAKTYNLRRRLAEKYDKALEEVDVLALPTTVTTAPRNRDSVTPKESIQRTGKAVTNTTSFNQTGHPAISVPCGETDGLPVGVMFVGKKFEDDVVLRAADAVERRRANPS